MSDLSVSGCGVSMAALPYWWTLTASWPSGAFAAVADEAPALCPVSRLFAGAKISADAELD